MFDSYIYGTLLWHDVLVAYLQRRSDGQYISLQSKCRTIDSPELYPGNSRSLNQYSPAQNYTGVQPPPNYLYETVQFFSYFYDSLTMYAHIIGHGDVITLFNVHELNNE